MILTRLLSPAEFGIVGIITSVFFAVALITDLGFQDFLIRHERTEEQHFRDVIWTIHATRGVGIFLLVAVASPLIASAFGKPVVAAPLAVASFIFVLNGMSSLSLMTALRHDKARELSLLEFGLQVFQTLACVLLAFWWGTAWSIIGAMLLQSALRSALSYGLFADSRQRLVRDPAISREFFVFSRLIMASSAMALVMGQIDKLVLGRVFTLAEFGLYSIALTIATAPVAFADSYINRIIFPICSEAWRREPLNLSTVYYSVRRLPGALYAFGCGGIIGSARLITSLLYDPRYAGAATFISLLMVGTALSLPNKAAAQLMIAAGQVRRGVHLTAVRLIWVIVSVPVGLLAFGPIGVVGALSLIEVPATLFCWLWLRRIGVFDLRQELMSPALIMTGAAVGWVGATLVQRFVPYL